MNELITIRGCLTVNGQRRPFPQAIEAFLQEEGHIVATVLRNETTQTISEIITACEEFQQEHIDAYPEPISPACIAAVLARLVDVGAAEIVVKRPSQSPIRLHSAYRTSFISAH